MWNKTNILLARGDGLDMLDEVFRPLNHKFSALVPCPVPCLRRADC